VRLASEEALHRKSVSPLTGLITTYLLPTAGAVGYVSDAATRLK
jgi:hypothetical protein